MTQLQHQSLAYARTHTAQETASSVDATTTLVGWVQRRRDLGSIVFVDLRDRTGLVQLVFDTSRGTLDEAMAVANQIRTEYVIAVTGQVTAREESAVNPRLETGKVEVVVSIAEVLNAAKTPPFYIQDGIEADETIRLRYRYLDLRRPEMQQMLKLRHQVFRAFRNYLDDHGFTEIETPVLTKSTPEGARDYVVPSRLEPGAFYALPQSPQLFKQLLMVAGMERYYQFARCFRDEDLRADRQPEFTQLDIETSFLSQEDLLAEMEQMFRYVFKNTVGVELETPFWRLTYKEAMETYGSDKPDLRFDMPIVDIGAAVKDASFRVFAETLQSGGVIKAIVAPGCADFSRKQTDELTQFVAKYGLKGLAPIAVQEASFRSPIAKFFTPEQLDAIVKTTGAKVGDLILIAAAKRQTALSALGALRSKLGGDLGLIDEDAYRFVWIVDFPLFSYDEEAGRYVAEHHPFTMPKWEDLELLDSDLGAVRAQAYDLVLNGFELSSGSMRIYRRDIQERMFEALGYSTEEAREKFGFLLDAFEYGTPPHGGIAFGLDRIIMIMGKGKSLRDVVAFPKTSSASDLMMHAPAAISPDQLEILGIQFQKKDATE
jgi:aspartyl-tRNA synthetase